MKKTMYMIGNAHLDPVWLWDWREGYAENNATMKSMIERLEEFDFVDFTSSSSVFYEWLEESSPKMFEEVRRLVQEGRWELCGGWYIQPDCNIPSGESFARQALIGQNYFYDSFGVISTIGYCVDSFGHTGTLPKLLNLARMDKYVFMRPGRHEKDIHDNLFIWEADDGSRVVAYRIPFNYNAHYGIDRQIEDCMGEFVGDFPGMMAFYGVGNHGGGPTIANIKDILRKKNEYSRKADIIFSKPSLFFKDVELHGIRLPVVKGDLQHHASGCYSVVSEVKQLNREAENALLRAEKWSVVSHLERGIPFDSRKFRIAWKDVLFNQFHDILAGTCVRSAYKELYSFYGEARSIAAKLENRALQEISFNLNIPRKEGSIPVAVFNPHGWASVFPVEIEGGHHKNMEFPSNPVLIDSDGNRIPFQIVQPSVQCRKRIRILFSAEIDSLGYSLFSLEEGSDEDVTEYNLSIQENTLENDCLKCTFSKAKGGLVSIIDKIHGVELLNDPAAVGTVVNDTSDTWGHATLVYHDVIGHFTITRMEKNENGPVRQRIHVVSTYGGSVLIQDFLLYSGSTSIDVDCKVFWAEHLKCLRLDFPIAIDQKRVRYEIPFGVIDKPSNGEEEPMQNWFDLSDQSGKGLAIINTGKYSGASFENNLSLNVLRSPVYSHHMPVSLEMDEDRYDFIDQGEQFFSYSILPHGKAVENSVLVRKGLELNQPFVSLIETYHDGPLAPSGSFLSVESSNVVFSSMKMADVGQGVIVRFYETDGKCCDCKIKIFCGKSFIIRFNPYEVKTIRITDEGDFWEEVDFLEWKKDLMK